MKKTILTIYAITLCFVVSAQKEIKSIYGNATMFVNPEFTPREFSKLLLITGTIDKDTNAKIQNQFKKIGMETVASLDVMPPVKEYTDDDLKAICSRYNVDGIVRVKVTDKDESSHGKGLIAIQFESQTIFNLEVSLFDVNNNVLAVNFVGTSASTKEDKAIRDYFRAIITDLESIVKKQ